MKDLDLIKGKTNLQHIGVGCSTRKLMTTCHSGKPLSIWFYFSIDTRLSKNPFQRTGFWGEL